MRQLSPKSETAGAVRYSLSRRRALTRYIGDGRLEIGNNPAERPLRVVALGRKNYLFAGSDAGGEQGHKDGSPRMSRPAARLDGGKMTL